MSWGLGVSRVGSTGDGDGGLALFGTSRSVAVDPLLGMLEELVELPPRGGEG